MLRRFVFLIVCAALAPLTGCGPKLHPVTGTVTMDGKPVADADVLFTSNDGKHLANGHTDDSGNFTLATGGNPGAYEGAYKVTVSKYPKVSGSSPGIQDGGMDKAYVDQMKKEMDKSKGEAAKGAGKGMMPPPGMMPGGGGAAKSGVKSELPEVYASIEKTTLTATVPAAGPVTLELKSK